jgi:hypothetical protein
MSAFRFRFALLSLIVALAGSAPATAITYRDASAGAVCHAANGALAAKFTYNLHYLTNVGTADAYVICNLVMEDATLTPEPLTTLSAEVLLAGAGTATCVAQVGYFYGSELHVLRSSAQTQTTVGPGAIPMVWPVSSVQRENVYELLVINCKLPPGAKMGLIQYWVGT